MAVSSLLKDWTAVSGMRPVTPAQSGQLSHEPQSFTRLIIWQRVAHLSHSPPDFVAEEAVVLLAGEVLLVPRLPFGALVVRCCVSFSI